MASKQTIGVKDEIIWDIVVNRIPILKEQIQSILDETPD
jgi:uncharacterized protein with HEPN domain